MHFHTNAHIDKIIRYPIQYTNLNFKNIENVFVHFDVIVRGILSNPNELYSHKRRTIS